MAQRTKAALVAVLVWIGFVCFVAWDAAGAAAGDAAGDAEERWQFDRLVLWLSEEEPAPFDAPVLEQAA